MKSVKLLTARTERTHTHTHKILKDDYLCLLIIVGLPRWLSGIESEAFLQKNKARGNDVFVIVEHSLKQFLMGDPHVYVYCPPKGVQRSTEMCSTDPVQSSCRTDERLNSKAKDTPYQACQPGEVMWSGLAWDTLERGGEWGKVETESPANRASHR